MKQLLNLRIEHSEGLLRQAILAQFDLVWNINVRDWQPQYHNPLLAASLEYGLSHWSLHEKAKLSSLVVSRPDSKFLAGCLEVFILLLDSIGFLITNISKNSQFASSAASGSECKFREAVQSDHLRFKFLNVAALGSESKV